MDVIDAKWLKARLSGDRGQRAKLAQALGLSSEKVSKMLGGSRKPQAEEIPVILAFFGETDDSVDPELADLWSRLDPAEKSFLINAARGQIASRGHPDQQGDEEE